MNVPISILDLALVPPGGTAKEAFDASVSMARRAEALGYRRIWYAEHHNMRSIASSATSVLIAHVAARTETIRLGAGGVMLPNHSPLVIAEQFGTLETLHPGRIDLGLGRAPGTDPETLRALRRDALAAESFPEDVVELRAYLAGGSRIPGVDAFPGKGTAVPLYILGSSLFGARLAAALGLPYAFASHFAPAALEQAVELYRTEFRPSAQLDRAHVIAGVNVIAANGGPEAEAQRQLALRMRVKALFGKGHGQGLTDEEADLVLRSPAGQRVLEMTKYFAAGTPDQVRTYLERFARHADADELMVVHASPTIPGRLQSVELVGQAMGLGAPVTPHAEAMTPPHA